MKPEEIRKVQGYLRSRFPQTPIQVRALPRKSDSAEVYIDEEFVGLIAKDEEEGELSYHFTMTILDIDLE
ncbi:DUF3126 family protein [Consotaella salsifontis]|uniref:DUF3126 domain-containing protein n=1 Tax=Consotaella salsifontis TaxID=1365950 RepID=A0A1T4L6R7_9HYPH|nr:DUF3126 family protein [Consotaella salsifontis]SJZ50422.1 Protein of unknown function [Consotaella salsifontis]